METELAGVGQSIALRSLEGIARSTPVRVETTTSVDSTRQSRAAHMRTAMAPASVGVVWPCMNSIRGGAATAAVVAGGPTAVEQSRYVYVTAVSLAFETGQLEILHTFSYSVLVRHLEMVFGSEYCDDMTQLVVVPAVSPMSSVVASSCTTLVPLVASIVSQQAIGPDVLGRCSTSVATAVSARASSAAMRYMARRTLSYRPKELLELVTALHCTAPMWSFRVEAGR